MSDKLSSTAARAVDDLSRRRFLTWVGGGVAAVAAGLGFERLSPAFAAGTACDKIVLRKLPRGRGFTNFRCVKTVEDCKPPPDAFNDLCKFFFASTCAKGEHCPPETKCTATATGGTAFEGCRSFGRQPCPHTPCPTDTPICCFCEVKAGLHGAQCGCKCL